MTDDHATKSRAVDTVISRQIQHFLSENSLTEVAKLCARLELDLTHAIRVAGIEEASISDAGAALSTLFDSFPHVSLAIEGRRSNDEELRKEVAQIK